MGCPPDKKFNKRDDIILGKEVGEILVKAIRRAAKKVLISSPWIGEGYAKMLIEKAFGA